MDKKVIVQSVIHTLNNVTVNGENNLDALLGSIRALKTLLTQLETEATEVDVNG